MKTLLLFLLLSSGFVFSQPNQSEALENNPNNNNTFPPNTSESDSLKGIQIHNDSINYKIAMIDVNLNSIQIKWDFVMNDSEEKLIAESNGWFDDMTAIKNSLYAEKDVLINLLK